MFIKFVNGKFCSSNTLSADYLECTFEHCDDGKSQCCDCENEHPQVTSSYEEINYDEYIDNLNDWD